MTLKLRIANVASLPDGGPVTYSVDGTGFEFGRDAQMDWTLPDPQRFVSSCHGEIRCENGGYWLHDHSTNGTFVNGAAARVHSPYALQQGDRIQVGHYILLVETLKAPGGAAAPGAFDVGPAPVADASDIWSLGETTPARDADFDPTPPRPVQPDFGDRHLSFGPDFGSPAAPPASPPGPIEPAVPPTSGDASPFGAPPPKPEPQTPAPDPAPPASEAPSIQPPDPDPAPATETAGVSESPSAPPAVGAPPPASEAPAPFPSPRPAAQPPRAAPLPVRPAAEPEAAAAFGPPPRPGRSRPPMAFPPAESIPQPSPPPAPATAGADAGALLRTLCEAAGLRPDAFDGVDPHAAAHEIGRSLRIMTAELAALLRVRTTIKTSFRSGSRTEMSAEANNPLKFVPTAEEALEVMFGRPRPGYQRGSEAVQASFSDINRHQTAVFAAIQPALAELIGDLAPESIEKKVETGPFGNKHAKAWELFVERWDAKTAPHENGMLDVFNIYFARAYDTEIRSGKK